MEVPLVRSFIRMGPISELCGHQILPVWSPIPPCQLLPAETPKERLYPAQHVTSYAEPGKFPYKFTVADLVKGLEKVFLLACVLLLQRGSVSRLDFVLKTSFKGSIGIDSGSK